MTNEAGCTFAALLGTLVLLLTLWAIEPKGNGPEAAVTVCVFSGDGSKKLGTLRVHCEAKADPPSFLCLKANAGPKRFFILAGLDSELADARWCYWEITDDIRTITEAIRPVEGKSK